jgi:large subunit ribosomal protein L25
MYELKVQKRDVFGKRTNSLKKQGFIPAELYGHGIENVHLSVSSDEFNRVYKDAGESSVINVNINGDIRPVFVRSVQTDSVTDKTLSVDFYQIKMDEKITTHVPIELLGEPPVVKDLGGIIVLSMEEVEVRALPMDIPKNIVVDVSGLAEFDQSIYIKDLPKSDKFEFSVDPETVIVSVTAPREEEKEVVEEITPEEVKVEGEEKRAEKEKESEINKTESKETD